MVIHATPQQFLHLGLETCGIQNLQNTRQSTLLRRFQTHFRTTPETVARIFYDIQVTDIPEARQDRPCAIEFLLVFYWLAGNEPEERIASRFDSISEKTVRAWKWKYGVKIAALKEAKVQNLLLRLRLPPKVDGSNSSTFFFLFPD